MPLSNWFRGSKASPLTPPDQPAMAKECAICQVALPAAARFCLICGRAVDGEEETGTTGGDPLVRSLQSRLVEALDGRYGIREVLGVGGMGVVFLADDVARERTVAIKVLRPDLPADANGVARFKREAEIAASLRHPGIIPIHEVGSEEGLHYFVMDFVRGYSLERLLRERRDEGRPLPVGAVVRILGDAAETLGYAHGKGVVHRDVKPANMMLDEEGRLLITDFGISKSAVARDGATTVAQLTDTGTVLGTPHYLAPEQALSKTVDGRADQYALGIVGFEMLVGRVPFDDETPHGIIHHHLNELPPRVASLREDVPPHLSNAIARALMKAPSHRFASMAEFARAIDGRADAASRRWRKVRWAVAAVVLLALAVGGAWLWRGPGARGQASRTASTAAKPAAKAPKASTKKPPAAATRTKRTRSSR
ncbi:MAG TPA: serine/threonine-protein kinase [Gemmatimonadaceae bacterium]|nr:serine/threonine-protein kinase [Gemmatimonadaceae bacterium]